MVTAFFQTFGLIALAELGDKSQLMSLAFATRYKPAIVLLGITIVAFTLNGLAALAGHLLGAALPQGPVQIGAGVLLILFGLWTLRELSHGHPEEEGETGVLRGGRNALIVVTASFFLAEFGDKTMFASATLATTQGFWITWLAAGLGMTFVNALVIGAALLLKKRFPERPVQFAAAALFIGLGLWFMVDGITGL